MLNQNFNYLETFGTSVIGPLHELEKRPNEDAWGRINGSCGIGIVVSDGMGSKPNARVGAKMTCSAVKAALLPWIKASSASPIILLRLIHLHWELKVLPALKEDSAATCLFAVVIPTGELIVAQLGDGIAVLKESDGKITILNSSKNFGNQTTALGIAKSTKEGSVAKIMKYTRFLCISRIFKQQSQIVIQQIFFELHYPYDQHHQLDLC